MWMIMDLHALGWQILHGSFIRRLLLRAFLLAFATFAFPLICTTFLSINGGCTVDGARFFHSSGFRPLTRASTPCTDIANATVAAFRDLMSKNLLKSDFKALCVGKGSASTVLILQELGLLDAIAVDIMRPTFPPFRRSFVYELDFGENSFDFVFSATLARVSVPALLVLEVERVLKPGGFGAFLLPGGNFASDRPIKYAMEVSSLLRDSNMVQSSAVGSFNMVIFRKKIDFIAVFDHFQHHIPSVCPAASPARLFHRHLEPLREEGKRISYLSNYMDTSARKRIVYVNMGAGEHLESTIRDWIKPFQPVTPHTVDVYLVDHDSSVLSSYVRKPGITFIYYPDVGENRTDESMYLGDEEFDFISWFTTTVAGADFVTVGMDAKPTEMKLLTDLLKSGAICHVNELFLRCSDEGLGSKGDCMRLLGSLRKRGLFVHWWKDI